MNILQLLKQLVEDYSGLEFSGIAEQRLHKEVLKACQRLELTAQDYFHKISHNPAELTAFVNTLTVNETYFYREPAHINLFVQRLLPRLLQQADGRPVRILSAGCSSGEEPYSLAMLIQETWGRPVLQQVKIDAGDLDENILAKARAGLYSPFSFRALESHLRDRYFKPVRQGYQILADIREVVRFFPLNLNAANYPAEENYYDAVFFRNVSIYFNEHVRRQIQHKLKKIMQPNALMILGSSETLANDFGVFQLVEEQGLYYFAQGSSLQRRAKPQATQATVPKPQTRRLQPAKPGPTLSVQPPFAPCPAVATTQEPSLQAIKHLLGDNQQHANALAGLEKILQQQPGQPVALLMKAWLYLNQKDFTLAASLLEQQLTTQPWCLDGLLAQGLCRKWSGDNKGAADSFKRACYSVPDSWLAHFHLAESLRQLDTLAPARQAYQTVRRILSNDTKASSGAQWLPLELPAKDILFLAERHLLNTRSQSTHHPDKD